MEVFRSTESDSSEGSGQNMLEGMPTPHRGPQFGFFPRNDGNGQPGGDTGLDSIFRMMEGLMSGFGSQFGMAPGPPPSGFDGTYPNVPREPPHRRDAPSRGAGQSRTYREYDSRSEEV